jgi:hypothetical protein
MHCDRNAEFPQHFSDFYNSTFHTRRRDSWQSERAACNIVSPKGGGKRNYGVGQKVKSEPFLNGLGEPFMTFDKVSKWPAI